MIFQIRVKIVNKHFLLLPPFRLTEKVFNVKRKKNEMFKLLYSRNYSLVQIHC